MASSHKSRLKLQAIHAEGLGSLLSHSESGFSLTRSPHQLVYPYKGTESHGGHLSKDMEEGTEPRPSSFPFVQLATQVPSHASTILRSQLVSPVQQY